MKKTIILLSATAILFSCKKDDAINNFTQTDVTGTTILKGNINKNIITPNGNGSWKVDSKIPAVGISISIKVNKNSLYPNSNAQGADVYTVTTNDKGDYSIAIKSNATGVAALISIDGFTSTLDTLINGTTKKGFYASYKDTTINRTLFMGQSSQLNYNFRNSNVITNPNDIIFGSAVITGSVGVVFWKQVKTVVSTTVSPIGFVPLLNETYTLLPGGLTNSTGIFSVTPIVSTTYTIIGSGTNTSSMQVIQTSTTNVTPIILTSLSPTNVAVANHKVYLNFSIDPTTLASKKYEVTTNANGVYSFNIATVAAGTLNFSQIADLWISDYAATKDTIKISNFGVPSVTITGSAGVFKQINTSKSGVCNDNIINATNLNYGTFIAN